ncbi:kinesin-like protein KIF3B isoform X2 [Homalodisca vitripennis]|uniref:kinesin-like protein KIF3B isoform X2 n=1 Tax=Homalodisca vitripennis TaxID=197043 RepID=UPI001EECD7CA|nr:kinesin-like protein KIF3B isoform X2 [Homalodisca vitripennis]
MTSVAIRQPVKNEKVQVVVRCRPMNEKEKSKGHLSVVKVYPTRGVVEIYDPKYEKLDQCKMFAFDAVYDWNCTQQEIYDETVRPLVNAVLNGFNGTIFAYGQTGTGKTYTMEGNKTDENAKGIIPKTFDQIFDHISRSHNMQYLVRASYLEIYQDEIRDLLDKNPKKKYELRENKEMGVYVKDVQSFVCKSVKQIERIMAAGNQNRTIGATDMNERSSRSHAIFIITVEMSDTKGPLENRVRVGKLNLVDLAGSERQNKTNSEGKRLKEASKINLSLTALGNVISALVDGKGQHIPYRDSKLTRLLRDSLGGNSKTLMVANIGPASYNYDESLNTLRYASRARNIKNEPRVNEDPVDALLRKYQEEIKRLKTQLAERAAAQKEQRHKSGKKKRSSVKMDDSVISNLSSDLSDILKDEDNILSEENVSKKKLANDKKNESEVEKEYVEELMKRIQSMESKLLRGSTNILDHTHEQQKALEARAIEIRERKQREQEIQQMLEMQEETAVEIKEEYSNLQQEVEMKSKKLKKMYHKLQNIQQEIFDVTEEFNTDRRELEMTQNELLKDLKLRLVIIENFIPHEERRRILSRLFFDEGLDAWKIMPESEPAQVLAKPQCVDYMRKPVTLYTVFTRRKVNHMYRNDRSEENREKTFRFKGEDILELELVGPLRTTRDYESPKMSPVLKSIFEAALQVEEDIDVDAANPSFRINSARTRPMSRSGLVPPPSRQLSKPYKGIATHTAPAPVYPKARGWVPK